MTVKAKATMHEGRILVRTTFGDDEFEDAKEACKSIAGARWAAPHKSWSYPLTVDVCHSLRQVFGEHLTVLPRLSDWYREGATHRAEHTAAASATDAELHLLPEVAPALASALRADQRVGAAWVANGYRGAGLVADQPGCGKTLVTIAGVIEADVKGGILVACPRLSVKPVWHRELTRWTNERVYIARGTRAAREKAIRRFLADPAERKWLVVVSEMLRAKKAKDTGAECMFPDCVKNGGEQRHYVAHEKATEGKTVVGYEYPELFEQQWGQVIVDESHKMFGSLTITKGNLAGIGLKEIGKRSSRRLAVTGTPFGRGGRVQGMFGTLHWLWPDEFTSFWRWAGTHFEIDEDEVFVPGGRGRTRTVKRIGGLKSGIDEEQFLHTLGPRILRRTKEEVLPWLPPKQYVDVMCEMSPAQTKQYKGLTDDAEIVTENGMITADGALALITRSKQIADGAIELGEDGEVHFTDDSSKIDMLFEKLEARGITDGSGDTKVIVASQFNEFLDSVGRRLVKNKIGYHLMVGKTSDAKRDKMMEQFQADGGHRVFLLNSKAGGVSVTLDAADEVHCLDEMWDPGDNEQLEDRAHRASRNHQVTIYRYLSEGTVDEAIAKDVDGKRFEQFRTLDGRRGREYVRNLTTYRKPKGDNS